MASQSVWGDVALKYKIDPETEATSRKFIEHGSPHIHKGTLEQCRQGIVQLGLISALAPGSFKGSVKDYIVPSEHVSDGIPVSVFTPTSAPPNPVIYLYLHGGGLAIGCRKAYEHVVQYIAETSGAIVLNVDYRLLPNEEDRFAPFNDSVTVAKWVLENKELLGGTIKSKVGIGGDSAGGQLASCVTNEMQGFDFQILVYPVGGVDCSVGSMQEFRDIPAFSGKDMEWLFGFSIPFIPDAETNPRVNPLARTRSNLELSPSTLVITAELDPLRDSGIMFAEKLKKAGVHCEHVPFKGVPHGFMFEMKSYLTCSKAGYKITTNFMKSYQAAKTSPL
ncbi:carboxylesterase NlhH [Aplysia californica]|uniref:Carboxylesterase NlhH n=1 Tax=Aplysia californica TaxID=6500 RepID=A0ABM0K0G5_APLCA|nr:carboxylesterase NlhH [Aplysia californica]